jgi:predicted metal-dependent hydrolase
MKLDGIDIAIEKTGRRKTVSIFIERDGSVRVLAPVKTTDETIENAVREKNIRYLPNLLNGRNLIKEK